MTDALFQLERAGDAVSVSGEVDATNAPDFARSVRELSGARPVILELSRLKYLDSAGFAAVDGLLTQGVVLVVSPQSLIRKAAELMDLPIQDDVEAARRVFSQA